MSCGKLIFYKLWYGCEFLVRCLILFWMKNCLLWNEILMVKINFIVNKVKVEKLCVVIVIWIIMLIRYW